MNYGNTNMITESFQNYKNYIIRLRAVTNNGFWYAIIKEIPSSSSPDGVKKLYLRKKGYNYILPEKLLLEAKNYIDNFSNNLEEKFKKLSNGNT